jgi:hypothetical protein
LEESCLLGGVPLQLAQIQFIRIARCSQGFLGFALNPALRFVALFLLSCVFFLAFSKA